MLDFLGETRILISERFPRENIGSYFSRMHICRIASFVCVVKWNGENECSILKIEL